MRSASKLMRWRWITIAPVPPEETTMIRRQAAALAALLGLAAPICSAQDATLGRNLAATCANCHGTNGQSRDTVPGLAGVPVANITAAMAEFKAGTRSATIMHQIAKGYTDDQIRLIAAYFAAQPAKK
jgi:sulfide dehydrogenase cytochrome subunit